MRWIYVLLLTIPAAVTGWWGVYDIIQKHPPGEPGALTLFYGVLALALSATVAPLMAYLNRRFAADAYRRDRWRFARQSAWCGLCLTSWAWLQMQRAFSAAYAVLIAIVFVAVELLFLRLKSKA